MLGVMDKALLRTFTPAARPPGLQSWHSLLLPTEVYSARPGLNSQLWLQPGLAPTVCGHLRTRPGDRGSISCYLSLSKRNTKISIKFYKEVSSSLNEKFNRNTLKTGPGAGLVRVIGGRPE